ncbi:MAG: UDP-N-acetylmuramoyl-L-alanine--D-glutamate ligase [Alcaligenaceae bacterium]|nr:UDP-N-acetylmuramoyl-L-alanine--D-glutamate ligase [Alcaligenaceae bacterium]
MNTLSENTSFFPSSVLVLGLGETGLAAALWCLQHQIRVRIADTRDNPPGLDRLDPATQSFDTFLGSHCFDGQVLNGVEAIVLSPGLVPSEPQLAALLDKAKQQDIEILGEVELFARALAQLRQAQGYEPKIIGVTGTNGKTTVTTMVRNMLQEAGLSAVAAGNISPSALTALMDCMASNALPDVWVMELSSFQLLTTQSLHPDASVVLNVTQDHLDWHADMQEYAGCKAKLLDLSQVAVINRDDELVRGMVQFHDDLNVRTFGETEPVLANDLGLEDSQGVMWLAASESDEFGLPETTGRKKKNTERPVRKHGQLKRLMPADAMLVRGRHNAMNALAAMALCRALGIGWTPLLNALRNYTAEPHRTNFVRSIKGVDFINDSKGTNVGSTVAALKGMGRKVVLIAGGLGKGQDFSPMVAPVARFARAVILIGKDAPVLEQALAPSGVQCIHAASLENAVAMALEQALEGDVVLLSPACASMDMFRNYNHRGDAFIDAVNELALDNGEVA